MPKIYFFHLAEDFKVAWTLSEGYFYTVGEYLPEGIEQQQYYSSGIHRMIAKEEIILNKIKEDILYCFSEEDNKYKFVIVNTIMADDDDYFFRFSGPPDNWSNIYKFEDNKLIFLEEFSEDDSILE